MPRSDLGLELYASRLLVRDFDRTWRFYRDVLGLTPAKGHGKPPYGEFVDGGRVILAIFERMPMARAVGLRPGTHARGAVGGSLVVFSSKDVDAVAGRLSRRGVAVLQGPTDRPDWGLRTIHLRDPDGRLVEIYSRLRR